MHHTHYYEITADNNFELGILRGELFGDIARAALKRRKHDEKWVKKVEISKEYFDITQQYFPQYIEELKGYAKASKINLNEFWTMSLEDEFDYLNAEHCTTVVTNEGTLLSHNEDWDKNAENAICVLKKTVNDLTTLELFYYNTLGGVSCTVNSHGYVMAINTLTSNDRRVGVPRNIIARWLSETQNIKQDVVKLKTIPRSLGYNHLFTHTNGQVLDLECSATQHVLISPTVPYVHTNHFTEKEMSQFEKNDNSTATYQRYEAGCSLVKNQMTFDEIKALNSDGSKGEKESILNERTIARMIVDLKNFTAHIWLKREQEKGWLAYDLDFIHR